LTENTFQNYSFLPAEFVEQEPDAEQELAAEWELDAERELDAVVLLEGEPEIICIDIIYSSPSTHKS
jgi:hypothetical protein